MVLRLCSLYITCTYADKILDPDTNCDCDMYYAVLHRRPFPSQWGVNGYVYMYVQMKSARMYDRLLRPKMAKGSVLRTSMITWSVGAA